MSSVCGDGTWHKGTRASTAGGWGPSLFQALPGGRAGTPEVLTRLRPSLGAAQEAQHPCGF